MKANTYTNTIIKVNRDGQPDADYYRRVKRAEQGRAVLKLAVPLLKLTGEALYQLVALPFRILLIIGDHENGTSYYQETFGKPIKTLPQGRNTLGQYV